jgi:hypothetical protein
VLGLGVKTHPIINGNSPMPTAGKTGYSVSITETMSQFASEQTPPATIKGSYELNFNCFAASTSINPDFIFVGHVRFKGTGDGTTNVYTNTVTTLKSAPSTSATAGKAVIFTATMSPPNAAGRVQFMDGSKKLGTPVKVSGGKAIYKTTKLAVGSHKIVASFAPSPVDTTGTWGSSYAVVPFTIKKA